MRILYIGTDDPLDWTRRQILSSAGYVVLDARDQAQAEGLADQARLAVISNLLRRDERKDVAAALSIVAPGLRSLAFESWDSVLDHSEGIPRQLNPNEFLKIVGTALMKQHQHPEIRSEYFLYVDYRRRYTHVSDGTCQLTGFSREEILGKSIEWLTYDEAADVTVQFHDYLESKKMSGRYILRSKSGRPIPVKFEATVLDDGCLCSELIPEQETN